MNYEQWMARANQQVGVLPEGTVFLLKELFPETDWKQLSNGDRRYFGRYFSKQVNEGLVPNVKFHEKAMNNSSLYIKR